MLTLLCEVFMLSNPKAGVPAASYPAPESRDGGTETVLRTACSYRIVESFTLATLLVNPMKRL